MPDEKDEELTPQQKADEMPKAKGKGTLVIEATKVAEEKAAKRRAEERERDAEQDERTDKVYGLALKQAEQRADDLKGELKAVREANAEAMASRDKKDRYQWIAIGVLILAIVGLAGYKVAGNLMGLGDVSIGGDAVEKKAKD